ncbi:hypothetical protein EUTSA_v10027203mg [Eutrema salsugineum]|uniref:RNase H type-1 domain-containing protein n=1 Tax=Eutrema salsugineum TaxID=72664 RepID=V4P7N0_EUTSA|nr:hypothetical protein EUTSA_v10027203mg [Eutrema salsugineum]
MAIQYCWSMGYRKVIFKRDYKNLVNLVNKTTLNFGFHNWIREIWEWKKKLQSTEFIWTHRENNQAADTLEKSSIPNNSTYVSHFYVPYNLSDVLYSDYLSFI